MTTFQVSSKLSLLPALLSDRSGKTVIYVVVAGVKYRVIHHARHIATTPCRNQRLQHSSAGIISTKDFRRFFPLANYKRLVWLCFDLSKDRVSLRDVAASCVVPIQGTLSLWNPKQVKVNSVHLITVKLDQVASTALQEKQKKVGKVGKVGKEEK